MEVFVFIGLAVALLLGLIGFSGDAVPAVVGDTSSTLGMLRIRLRARRTLSVIAVVIDSTKGKYLRTAQWFG